MRTMHEVHKAIGLVFVVAACTGEQPVNPESTATGAAFQPVAAGELLRFCWTEAGPIDENTHSLWDFSGRAVDGPLRGE
ncbi:MAG: hypothetical protein ACE5M4_05130 [Anaerolineales bacterium]